MLGFHEISAFSGIEFTLTQTPGRGYDPRRRSPTISDKLRHKLVYSFGDGNMGFLATLAIGRCFETPETQLPGE